ncbi:MAG: Gfo/Idh/MocA family oxidoreductase [Armatimonadetes bacterium]|nr:Gfo/Idh/MocA family oxidoreductase [Armatimonadota bacterium]
MSLKIGLCGAGQFGTAFVPVFQRHPDVSEVYLADVVPDRLATVATRFGVTRTFDSLEALCASDCDCVALFTQRWLHGPQAVHALKSGKHVYSAVPAGISLEELAELVETVEATGLIYMLGETSYYRAQTTFCRDKFAAGEFGQFVYGEGQYHHDMAHFYASYMYSGGDEWKKTASFPPMLYPTHSTAFVLGVTFRRMTEVSCFGQIDRHPDGVFRADVSLWQNEFSNQSALFRTSDGGMARVNEFRRVGAGDGRMTIMGTRAAYEEQPGQGVFTWLDFPEGFGETSDIPYRDAAKLVPLKREDVSGIRVFDGVEVTEENLGNLPREYLGKKFLGLSHAQPWWQLPIEFAGVPNGHDGTHVFLVNDFVRSVVAQKLPPNHVWQAARYNAPGIVAHESAKRDGERMSIPDFGMPPADWATLDETFPLQP